jgi:hypothetical protein
LTSDQRFGAFFAGNATQFVIVQRAAAHAVATTRSAEAFAIGAASFIRARLYSVPCPHVANAHAG